MFPTNLCDNDQQVQKRPLHLTHFAILFGEAMRLGS